MSNFYIGEDGETVYTEPRGVAFYRGEIVLSSEFEDADQTGLCVTMHGGDRTVSAGIMDEADVQEFLYAAAVQARLIVDGEPLILMKKVTADAEDLS